MRRPAHGVQGVAHRDSQARNAALERNDHRPPTSTGQLPGYRQPSLSTPVTGAPPADAAVAAVPCTKRRTLMMAARLAAEARRRLPSWALGPQVRARAGRGRERRKRRGPHWRDEDSRHAGRQPEEDDKRGERRAPADGGRRARGAHADTQTDARLRRGADGKGRRWRGMTRTGPAGQRPRADCRVQGGPRRPRGAPSARPHAARRRGGAGTRGNRLRHAA